MRKSLLIKLILILIVIVGIGTIIYFYFPKILADTFFPLEYKDQILKYSQQYNLDPTLVAGVIYSESHFNKDAVSRAGASGLMQIMPATGRSISNKIGDSNFNVDNLFDPDTNIRYGCWYLRYLMDNYSGEVNAVLAGYNGGGAVGDRYVISRDAGIPQETQGYIRKVNFAKSMYDNIYGPELGGVNVAEKLRVKQENKPSYFQLIINYFVDTIRGQ